MARQVRVYSTKDRCKVCGEEKFDHVPEDKHDFRSTIETF